jgi:hypothetical protein
MDKENKETVTDPENQWRDGGHGRKTVFEAYSRQRSSIFLMRQLRGSRKNSARGGGRRVAYSWICY